MVTLLCVRYQMSLILADIKGLITLKEFQYEVNPEGATVNFSDVKGVILCSLILLSSKLQSSLVSIWSFP